MLKCGVTTFRYIPGAPHGVRYERCLSLSPIVISYVDLQTNQSFKD